jgi:uncharacterized membrane protein YeaQ/YmgE (transglycosylase-associated protein family)
MQKLIIGLLIGWVASEIAKDALEAVGLPKHTATVAGGIIGALA